MWAREAFEARIYTRAYRVYGLVYLPPKGGMAELLGEERGFLPVTGALVYAPGFRHPPDPLELRASLGFLALRKDRIQWLAGGRPSEPPLPPAALREQPLALFFGDYLLAGRIRLPKGLRVSDHLAQALKARPFLTLWEARLYPLGQDRPLVDLEPAEAFPFVTVNLRQVEGVAEAPEPRPGDPRLTLLG